MLRAGYLQLKEKRARKSYWITGPRGRGRSRGHKIDRAETVM